MQPPFLPLSPPTGVIFHVKNINDVGFILPKEETNYRLCMAVIQIIKTLILAFVQKFSGLVLHKFEEVLTCSDEL